MAKKRSKKKPCWDGYVKKGMKKKVENLLITVCPLKRKNNGYKKNYKR